jgi:hypothetical protein
MACVAISQIVKQTMRLRTGNGCLVATAAAIGPLGELPTLETRLLMMRSAPVMWGASLAKEGKVHASELPPYSLVFMPKVSRPDRAPLFRLGEIFRCHSRGCSRSLVRDTVQSLKSAQVCAWLPDSPRLKSLRLAWHLSRARVVDASSINQANFSPAHHGHQPDQFNSGAQETRMMRSPLIAPERRL